MIKKWLFSASIILGCFAAARAAGDGVVHNAALVDKNWKFDAVIVSGKDQQDKSIFSSQDIVYLNAGTSKGLAPGVRCGVYREGEKMDDPETGKTLGHEMKRMGTLEITQDASARHSSGVILDSVDTIQVGDLVRKE